MFQEYEELVALSRLALTARKQDVQLFVRRLSRRLRKARPDVADQLDAVLVENPGAGAPLRGVVAKHLPVDADSRLNLARPEYPVVVEQVPILADWVLRNLEQVVSERRQEASLLREGLHATKSVLLTGMPGVGKSLAARWIASKLDRPLVTLDLSAVMSSYLGRTGANVRQVLDYAKGTTCVLLLDELDAVAKRRDDNGEVGELKRLVTVLLQEIDDWPASGLLVAATNHPDLLDPAIWRRFEMVVDFPMPTREQTQEAVRRFWGQAEENAQLLMIASSAFEGMSFSEIEREMIRARREVVISGVSLESALQQVVHDRLASLPVRDRKEVAVRLVKNGFSQYEAKRWTSVHRSTIRSAIRSQTPRDGRK
jgi:SpoVK/Ycf46/Vps4 family AAA+-type ATPase